MLKVLSALALVVGANATVPCTQCPRGTYAMENKCEECPVGRVSQVSTPYDITLCAKKRTQNNTSQPFCDVSVANNPNPIRFRVRCWDPLQKLTARSVPLGSAPVLTARGASVALQAHTAPRNRIAFPVTLASSALFLEVRCCEPAAHPHTRARMLARQPYPQARRALLCV